MAGLYATGHPALATDFAVLLVVNPAAFTLMRRTGGPLTSRH